MTGSMYATFITVCLYIIVTLSIDSDVALWKDKLAFDGKPHLPTACHFLLVTKEQHSEFDTFKGTYPEATTRGYSMFPMILLLSYWNKYRATPLHSISMFNRNYIQLSSMEVYMLCS